MKTEQSRRSFFATMALGVSATAFPMMMNDFDQLDAITNFNTEKLENAEKWFKKIKGKHRIAYDGSQPHGGLPVIWNWAFYTSNNETGSSDSDITAMTVLRHTGIAFAFNSKLWAKYKLGAHFNVKDPQTGEASLRNYLYAPQKGDMPLPAIDGIKRMQERGGLFCVCNLAISVHAGILSKKMNLDSQSVYKELTEGLLPGVQLVPSGVWALGRAQENGCGYIFAG
ncbi:MAG: Tat (twin-arginine translocation) pathway signal sequence containing protein [Flavobacteriaceae bacterium]